MTGEGSAFNVGGQFELRGTATISDDAVANAGFIQTSGSLTVSGGARLNLNNAALTNQFSSPSNTLITGTGTLVNFAGTLSINGSVPSFVVTDNAVVNVNAATQSNLGQNSRLVISNGAVVNVVGGLRVGGNIEATGATVNLGTGIVTLGDSAGSGLTLLNSSFTAGSINSGIISNTINLGGTATSAAGAVGPFNVGTINLRVTDFVINHTDTNFVLASRITGSNSTIRHLAGTTIMTGTEAGGVTAPGTYQGQTLVTGGTLLVNGSLGNASHTMNVSNGATLGGTGRIGGNVTIADATLGAGNSVGTLTFGNNLALSAASILEFELGAPGATPGMGSDLITVLGNLTLDGTLNITNAGGFGAGLYRLFDYGGTLTNNGLEFGGVPMGFTAADLSIQTSVARQVNLIVAAPPPALTSFSFWDGANLAANNAIDGGTGTWSAAGRNWTVATGAANGAYDPDALLIFAGTGGRVTIAEPGGIAVNTGLQFASNGYVIGGDRIALGTGPAVIRVGDGTTQGAGSTAIIEADIGGAGSMEKSDLGTLILTGNAAPAGGTRITSGTLQIGNGGTAGTISGDILNLGTLVFNARVRLHLTGSSPAEEGCGRPGQGP